MTTIEAIKELKDASDSEVRYGDTNHHYDEVMKRVEAFDMAIKALEEISRLPENLHREREQAYMNGYADAKSTCRWISVDDKLPEENQRALVIYRSMIGDTDEVDVDYIKGEYWQNHGGVIAWMSLPEWEGMEYDEERNTMTIKVSYLADAKGDTLIGKYQAITTLDDLPSVTPQHKTWSLDDAREDFMSDVYNTLDFLPTNNEANRIIDSFDRVTSGLRQEPKTWSKVTNAEEAEAYPISESITKDFEEFTK